jgi:predicted transcriptional regulator
MTDAGTAIELLIPGIARVVETEIGINNQEDDMKTKVKEMMTKNPVIIPAETSLVEAAKKMRSVDCGVLPVGSWNNLEGIITDRDIVVRAVAEGANINSAKVRDYMTKEVFYCNEEDTLAQMAEQMRKNGVSRLVVKDYEGNACGIVTFGCILRKNESLSEIGEVVENAVGDKAA